ncbi:MAG TPA: relaxase domain-containing protein, partial [Gemmatimonadales bacterium]|nr:relaxase domain-containing protein [Gemmatimonadales bacterium]
MLSSAKIGVGCHRYYTAQVACTPMEYYLGIGDERGRWHGRGLPELGLARGAVVQEAQLEALFARALHPVTGRRLGRAWRIDGVEGSPLSGPASMRVLVGVGWS